MIDKGEWLICWERPRDGQPRYEWYGSREDAEAQIADWRIGYPWNTYLLVRVEKVFEATAPLPQSAITVL
jgi:hypothetical protein